MRVFLVRNGNISVNLSSCDVIQCRSQLFFMHVKSVFNVSENAFHENVY